MTEKTAYIGLDDTDVIDSPGTGQLARKIAESLASDYPVHGVVRHQLFFDPRVPYTAKNSSASIIITAQTTALDTIFEQVRQIMLQNFQEGSDPGLAVAADIAPDIVAFAKLSKVDLVSRDQAQKLAQQHDIRLIGLGGTEDGMIGALASIGLAADGNDGRYIQLGKIRELSGQQPVAQFLAAGIKQVQTLAGEILQSGLITADRIRPARRKSRPILFVEPSADEIWQALKLD